jgi:hypothetical protein
MALSRYEFRDVSLYRNYELILMVPQRNLLVWFGLVTISVLCFAIYSLLTLFVIDGTCIYKSETTLTLKCVLGFPHVRRTKYVPGTGHVPFHAARLSCSYLNVILEP